MSVFFLSFFLHHQQHHTCDNFFFGDCTHLFNCSYLIDSVHRLCCLINWLIRHPNQVNRLLTMINFVLEFLFELSERKSTGTLLRRIRVIILLLFFFTSLTFGDGNNGDHHLSIMLTSSSSIGAHRTCGNTAFFLNENRIRNIHDQNTA